MVLNDFEAGFGNAAAQQARFKLALSFVKRF